IKAIVNSRSLTSLTDNAKDLDVLTPNHFFTEDRFTTSAEADVTSSNDLLRWQRIE
ncbi:hypothetical protein ILUMI_09710, partial [Ignelater luminosus]